MVDLSWITSGPCRVIRYMKYRDRFPARDYLNAIPTSVKAAVLAIAQQLADRDEILDWTRFHRLKGEYSDLYEFKPRGHRIFCFHYEQTTYLTNGGPKQNAKAQKSDYDVARNMRLDFIREATNKKARNR